MTDDAAMIARRSEWGHEEVARLEASVRSRALNPRAEDDAEVEAEFRRSLSESFPADAVLGEEIETAPAGGGWSGEGWVIDPIDGTTNYRLGVPYYAIAVARFSESRVVESWVVDPAGGQRWHTSEGNGVSTSARPVTGEWARLVCLPHRLGPRFPEWARAVGRRYKGRSFGAVALEMAWVAHGRLAGGVWLDARIWDIAAASLLVREAGFRLLTLDDLGNTEFAAAGEGLRERRYTVVAGRDDAVFDHLAGFVASENDRKSEG